MPKGPIALMGGASSKGPQSMSNRKLIQTPKVPNNSLSLNGNHLTFKGSFLTI